MLKRSKNAKLDNSSDFRSDAIIAWNELMPNLAKEDLQALLNFGEKYGILAMVRRAQSIIEKRKPVPPDLLMKIRNKLDFIVSMRNIRRSRLIAGGKVKRQNIPERKRKEFVKGFAVRSEPVVRSLLTLAFTRKVVERYLSREEILKLTGIEHTEKDLVTMKKLIVQRSGQSMAANMKEVQNKVEAELAQMWAANLADAKIIAANPLHAKAYQQALESGDVAELAAFYMKGLSHA